MSKKKASKKKAAKKKEVSKDTESFDVVKAIEDGTLASREETDKNRKLPRGESRADRQKRLLKRHI